MPQYDDQFGIPYLQPKLYEIKLFEMHQYEQPFTPYSLVQQMAIVSLMEIAAVSTEANKRGLQLSNGEIKRMYEDIVLEMKNQLANGELPIVQASMANFPIIARAICTLCSTSV